MNIPGATLIAIPGQSERLDWVRELSAATTARKRRITCGGSGCASCASGWSGATANRKSAWPICRLKTPVGAASEAPMARWARLLISASQAPPKTSCRNLIRVPALMASNSLTSGYSRGTGTQSPQAMTSSVSQPRASCLTRCSSEYAASSR